MDVNGDGKLDVLSGSYSRMEQDMAGLFQVLYGEEGGTFQPAQTLLGSDGEPLLLPNERPYQDLDAESEEASDLTRICTRPTAVDFDGDGHLDIVAGNFAGTFYLFKGEGPGQFVPEAALLRDRHGAPLKVPMHSDPVLYDWDGDGDLDLLSGSGQGGVFLALNVGTRKAPSYEPFRPLIPTVQGYAPTEVTEDDSHLTGPSSSTRIWVADVDGDGKPDLLVGDSVTVVTPAPGLGLETAKRRYAALMERQMAIWKDPADVDSMSEEELGALNQARMTEYQELEKEFAKVIVRDRTGYVWLYRQK